MRKIIFTVLGLLLVLVGLAVILPDAVVVLQGEPERGALFNMLNVFHGETYKALHVWLAFVGLPLLFGALVIISARHIRERR